ncbi:probable leucine-rich repeat receptor-like protein kinase At2g33170 [Dioscorea cayenensis subsp. rotundata]|uniref:Probable leucine-rich repeat receptor-like protein kinase At2g33170 n=1 Tax=Dioscorea cayennensis subsp. rotundata TaxID=55577 RepID=A0AB40CT66_DIOCR|nr:probable leucine-rich repeat receptor-like protein kinase At2g33170 [Dioscorea cayenensis subsp. rotundata]
MLVQNRQLSKLSFPVFATATVSAKLSLPYPLISFLESLPQSSQCLLLLNNTLPPCQWSGVSCSSNSTSITSIDLSKLGLSGQLSSSASHFCRITTLREIILSYSNISRPIPPFLFHCTSLTSLCLGYNSLSGPIPPNVLLATHLTELVLSYNFLFGIITSDTFVGLRNLQYLFMEYNDFTGELPRSLLSLTGLTALDLSKNQFNVTIPEGISQLLYHGGGALKESSLFSSSLGASCWRHLLQPWKLVSPWKKARAWAWRKFPSLASVEHITFSCFDDDPDLMDVVYSVGWLNVAAKARTCSISVSSIIFVHLYYCSYLLVRVDSDQVKSEALNPVGPNPTGLGRSKLWSFQVTSFVGSLLPELGNCNSLVELQLQFNLIRGPIPPEISNLKKLEKLYLYDNELEGIIPP